MAKPTTPKPFTDNEVQEAISITPEVIQEEYARVGPHLQHFRALLSKAKGAVERAEVNLETIEANLRQTLRASSADAKRGSADYMTNDDIDAAIARDVARLEAAERAIAAREARDELEGICEAIRTKREMLVSLGADLREERFDRRRGN